MAGVTAPLDSGGCCHSGLIERVPANLGRSSDPGLSRDRFPTVCARQLESKAIEGRRTSDLRLPWVELEEDFESEVKKLPNVTI